MASYMKSIKPALSLEPTGRKTREGETIYASEYRFDSANDVHSILNHKSPTLGHWHEESTWRDDGYRAVWVNLLERRIVTYCEGDLTMVECSTLGKFLKELASCHEFYCPSIVKN